MRDAEVMELRRTVTELVHTGENRIELEVDYRKQLGDEAEVGWAMAVEKVVTPVAAEVEGWPAGQGVVGLPAV